MSHPPMDVKSSEDARLRAEYHRQQIAQTLDSLTDKISGTVQTAQAQINKPLTIIRKNPLATLGASLAVGVALALLTSEKRSRETRIRQDIAQAYYDGRRDEYDHRPPKQLPTGSPHRARPGGLTFRSTLLDMALPVIRTLSGNMAELMIARKFRR